MNREDQNDQAQASMTEERALTSELLILPDGRILVHNLTPVFAQVLRTLNPDDDQIRPRTQDIQPATQ